MNKQPPPGWGNDSITGFFEKSRENSFASFYKMERLFKHLIQINNLFFSAIEYMENSENWFELLFFLKAHSSFLSAVGLASSGQMPETFMVLRGALESSLYGLHIHNNPSLNELWLKRHKSEENLAKMKDAFAIGKSFNTLKKLDSKLWGATKTLYGRTINYGAHPNPKSLLPILERHEEEKAIEFKVQYLTGNLLNLKMCLRSTAQVGIACLKILKLIMPLRFKLTGLDLKLGKASQNL